MQTSASNPATTLDKEIATANDLAELLKREQAHLISADVNALSMLTDEKSRLVAQLAALTTSRYQALVRTGHPAEEAGMKAWLETSSAPRGAREAWQALLKLAQAAKELNRTNGLLINRQMARNDEALTVLRGPSQSNSLYGPNGQATGRPHSRGLVVG